MVCSGAEIQQLYWQDTKENGFHLPDLTEIRRTAVKTVFPEVLHKNRRVRGSPVWVYSNLTQRKSNENLPQIMSISVADYLKAQATEFG